MITKTVRTTQGKVKINIPDDLREITIGQMIDAEKETETVPYIPSLTKEIADNIIDVDDLVDIRERCLSLAHKIKYCYNETDIPKTITIGTKPKRFLFWRVIKENKIKVITNLSVEPAGAYLACRDLIADEINRHINLHGEENWKDNFVPSIDVCAGLLAHYFYCGATGELYTEQKAEAFKEEIYKLNVQDALPIARYFFLKFPDLSKQKISLWQAVRQTWNARLALKRLKNSGT